MTIEDVASAALVGLWHAEQSFDPARGKGWIGWSRWRAWDEMDALVAAFRRATSSVKLDELDQDWPEGERREHASHAPRPIDQLELRDELRQALLKLTKTQRSVLLLRAAGLTVDEVGAVLGKSGDTVSSHAVHGRTALDAAYPIDERSERKSRCATSHRRPSVTRSAAVAAYRASKRK